MLKAFATTAVLFLIGIGWSHFAPQSLGGPIEVLTTKGNSMEPLLHDGDLVIIRRDRTPSVGEVLAYHSDQIESVVLHRVIAKEDDRLVFKGDNNDWVDPELIASNEVLGSYWFHIPGVGRKFSMLQDPLFATIFVMITTMIVYVILFARPVTRNRRRS